MSYSNSSSGAVKILPSSFFDEDAILVAKKLLGKVLRVQYRRHWLSAMIIETEAYYLHDKASHASLGYTEKRKALFMPPGTLYLYYARGGDSLNISCQGEGNAVLIKAGIPYFDNEKIKAAVLPIMQRLNPVKNSTRNRLEMKLCSGQTLLCKALGLRVKVWDQQQFDPRRFYIEEIGYRPAAIIQTKRLGIPLGRDEHLFFRFIDHRYADFCTRNPIKKQRLKKGEDYFILER